MEALLNGGLTLLVRHLEEQEVRQLLDIVAIADAVVAEDVAIVPEALDYCGWFRCHKARLSLPGFAVGPGNSSRIAAEKALDAIIERVLAHQSVIPFQMARASLMLFIRDNQAVRALKPNTARAG